MRNLKKILALVLALVMSMSLMATAGAFKDSKDIDASYDEAVTVLSNLKVFQGYKEGDDFVFQPKASITRAEVAAIIYRITTGDVTDARVALYSNEAKFEDVKSTDWFAGYVGYCANAGYIRGYDAKHFGPQDNVTGYQALAMILRAVGYDKNGEFAGAGWQVKTASTATELGLLRNVNAAMLNSPASREVVAEILFRTISEAYIVDYTTAFGYKPVAIPASQNQMLSLGLSYIIDAKRDTEGKYTDGGKVLPMAFETLGHRNFRLQMIMAEVEQVNYGASIIVTGNVNANNYGSTKTVKAVINGAQVDYQEIGKQVRVYVQANDTNTVLNAVSAPVIVTNEMNVSTNGTSFEKLDVATEGYAANSADSAFKVYFNGKVVEGAERAAALKKIANVGVMVKFIDNDFDNHAEIVSIFEYTPANVNGITNDQVTGTNAVLPARHYFDNGNVVETKKMVVTNDEVLNVGDLVTYIEYNGVTYVTKAPVYTETLTSTYFSTVANGVANKALHFVIGDQTFVKAAAFVGADAALKRGQKVHVFTDPYGYMLQAAPVVNATEYLYVLRADHGSNVHNTRDALVVMNDGSVQVVTLGKAANAFETDAKPEMYSYTVSDAGIYKVKQVCGLGKTETIKHFDGVNYENGKTKLDNGAHITKDTVVIDVRNADKINAATGSVQVYTGFAEIPSVKGATFHCVVNNGFVTMAFLSAGKNVEDLSKSFIVYQLNKDGDGNWVDADGIYHLAVIVKGEKAVAELSKTQYDLINKYGVGEYTFDGNVLTNYTAFNEKWTNIKWQGNTLVDTTNDVSVPYTADTMFSTLDITGGKAYTYTMNFGTDNAVKAYVKTDKKGIATEIYVINGELADALTDGVKTVEEFGKTYYVADKKITKAVITGDEVAVAKAGAIASVKSAMMGAVQSLGMSWDALMDRTEKLYDEADKDENDKTFAELFNGYNGQINTADSKEKVAEALKAALADIEAKITDEAVKAYGKAIAETDKAAADLQAKKDEAIKKLNDLMVTKLEAAKDNKDKNTFGAKNVEDTKTVIDYKDKKNLSEVATIYTNNIQKAENEDGINGVVNNWTKGFMAEAVNAYVAAFNANETAVETAVENADKAMKAEVKIYKGESMTDAVVKAFDANGTEVSVEVPERVIENGTFKDTVKVTMTKGATSVTKTYENVQFAKVDDARPVNA